ncbi:ABC transporter substrate-binding protein [Homoserinimonas sp. OAct 916]|uniref:ABC transporter substrate-binding protein n=1 Tax=Homoserinimonas sp. OAct 916 TaxID=2211450 RepID=UPI000DBE3C78|nr:ABC transporter substrate-binding protein [Homoserinimonas sp. OAct 916]
MTKTNKLLTVLASVATVGLLASCANAGTTSGSDAPAAGEPMIIGTTDKVVSLDPAGAWDLGSATLHNQVYRWLLTSEPGDTQPVPDLAETAEFTSDTEFTVTMKDGLTFANGNPLTASDVKFSFDRMVAIADANGPSQLLSDLKKVTVDGDSTVVFELSSPNNILWPQLLTSPAAIIVDEDTFPADALADDNAIVKANAFDGQFTISTYEKNSLLTLQKNETYNGILDQAATPSLVMKYYSDDNNLKLDLQQGNIDVVYRTLGPTAVADLEKDDALAVHTGPGGEMRYIVFNFDIAPFGNKLPDADPAKALAVRQAVADLIDREPIADQVFKGTYAPAYTQVPSGLDGSTDALKRLYGDGNGGPDVAKATKRLADAGVSTPVALNLQYNTDHYGSSSSEEYAAIKEQLDSSGLFAIDLQSTEWTQYVTDSETDYPAYQLGWFSDFPDTDNYINVWYGTPEFPSILGAHTENPELNALIEKERVTADPDERTKVMEQAQEIAASYLPTIPLFQGSDIVIAKKSIQGIDSALDASLRFRFAALSQG